MCPALSQAIHESDVERDTNTFCSFFHGSENMIKAMPTAPIIQEKNGVVNGQSHQWVGTTADWLEAAKSE